MSGQRLAGLLMISQSILFTIETAMVHHVGTSVSVMQLALLRGVGGVLLVVALARSIGWAVVKTNQLGLQLLRGVVAVCYGWVLMYTFGQLPFADATAISFTVVAYITVFSALILHERITALRWLASATGMVGALLITKPAFVGWNIVYLVALLGTSLNGLAFVLNKYVQRPGGDTELTTMFYANAVMIVGNLPVLALVDLPAPAVWPWLSGVLVFGPIGMYVGIVALRYGSASSLGPLTLLRLVFAAVGGVVVFNEIPDLLTCVGAALVLASCWVAMRPTPAESRDLDPAQ
ncbi:MAG TPA: DMT family transporter [Vineibacter sp.]|nr:DMT family transporter [Vineibacter sp.]